MTKYNITISNYESGLTRKTVEQMFREMYEGADARDVEITVVESEE